MWWVQYVLLFLGAVIASIGTFKGVGRGFASLLGTFAWFVFGNASAAVVYYDGTGAQHVAQSIPLTWLCYGVAAVHALILLLTLHDIMTGDEETDEIDDLAQSIDPAGEAPDLDIDQ